MGVDIHIRIAKYNEKTNKYNEIILYRKRANCEKYEYKEDGTSVPIDDPYIRASVYDGRNSEMFNGMADGDEYDGYGRFPWYPIRLNSLEDSFKEEIKEIENTEGYYDFYEISLTELANYVYTHPEVTDYDVDTEIWDKYEKGERSKPVKPNPIKYIYDNIHTYIEFADWNYWGNDSDYKVIFYFDH